MNAYLTALALILTPTALVIAWIEADAWLESRADARRRVEQGRQVDREWLRTLAETETTPVYDQLACEAIERAEGWVQ